MNRRKALRNTGILAGATIAAPSMLLLLDSCKSESSLSWKPQFFTSDEAEFISSLVDTILPTTDTPGGLDVKAHIFIDRVVAQVYDKQGQEALRKDIADFNNTCKENHGNTFVNLSTEDKSTVLKEEESKGAKFNGGVWGTAVGEQEPVGFYRSIKSTIIWAYTSSEEIGKNVLNYDPIPGQYIGCIPLEDVGNKWSL